MEPKIFSSFILDIIVKWLITSASYLCEGDNLNNQWSIVTSKQHLYTTRISMTPSQAPPRQDPLGIGVMHVVVSDSMHR